MTILDAIRRLQQSADAREPITWDPRDRLAVRVVANELRRLMARPILGDPCDHTIAWWYQPLPAPEPRIEFATWETPRLQTRLFVRCHRCGREWVEIR